MKTYSLKQLFPDKPFFLVIFEIDTAKIEEQGISL